MDTDNFNPDALLEIARMNQPFILRNELESGVPLNYIDANGRYVFMYRDGTVLLANMELSFNENWDRHKAIMAAK